MIGSRRENADRRPEIPSEGPLWQAEASLTRTAEGVGIGLYLAKLLTETLGGRIDVESHPDRGTRVVLTLPHLDEEGGREGLQALRRAGPGDERSRKGPDRPPSVMG